MKNKILFVLSVLFGIMMINAGLNKFFNYMPMPAQMPEKMIVLMKAFVDFGWLLPLVAVVEIIGGILIMIPKARALGAIVILPIMVGIILTNIFTDTSGLPIALVFAIINFWVIFENRQKYFVMIK